MPTRVVPIRLADSVATFRADGDLDTAYVLQRIGGSPRVVGAEGYRRDPPWAPSVTDRTSLPRCRHVVRPAWMSYAHVGVRSVVRIRRQWRRRVLRTVFFFLRARARERRMLLFVRRVFFYTLAVFDDTTIYLTRTAGTTWAFTMFRVREIH